MAVKHALGIVRLVCNVKTNEPDSAFANTGSRYNLNFSSLSSSNRYLLREVYLDNMRIIHNRAAQLGNGL